VALPGSHPTSSLTVATANRLVDLFELAPQGNDRFVSTRVRDERFALYGGQVVAQALCAAGLTTGPERTPHSLHCYFLRPGVASEPVVFDVVRDRDGRSYSSRRVAVSQNGKVISSLSASFTEPTGADLDAAPAPSVPGPEGLADVTLPRVMAFDARQIPPDDSMHTRFWARCTEELPNSPLLHTCALAYLSDTNSRSFVTSRTRMGRWGPSLDHSLWFHARVRLDEWVLTSKSLQTVAAGRGYYTGTMHDRAGRLLASVSQEALHVPRQVKPTATP
jgi:acyl-CoA thioesterase II